MFRVLCTGDVHMGRRISKVSEVFRTSSAWTRIVELAISENVDLLAISGDLIDKEGKSYEAIGPLEAGLRELEQAGIPTVAVSGNHDFDILHRLAGLSASTCFQMLGRHGTWERATYTNAGGEQLHVDGWSFPSEHVQQHPMDSYPYSAVDNIPVMGLLHGEVDVMAGRYAPIALGDLWNSPVQFWLLGHIHDSRPYHSTDGRIALYPGSPWAMDPGEPKVHGVWIAGFEHGVLASLTSRSISPVHFIRTAVDVSTVGERGDFLEAMAIAMRELGQNVKAQHTGDDLRIVSCRLDLVGRSPYHDRFAGWKDEVEKTAEPILVTDDVTVQLDILTLAVRPAIDLNELAAGTDPAGELARLIQSLSEENESNPSTSRLLQAVNSRVEDVRQHSTFVALRMDDVQESLPNVRQIVEDEAWRLLSTLIAQREQS